jgi:lipopolysaccharide transport system ATP-binding protein
MSSVLNLCQRAIWLHHGAVRASGGSKAIAEAYLQYTLQEVYGEEACLQAVRRTPDPKAARSPDEPAMAPAVLDYASRIEVRDHLSEANGWKSGAGEILSVHLTRSATAPMASLKVANPCIYASGRSPIRTWSARSSVF